MKRLSLITFFLATSICIGIPGIGFGGDLDDGISKFTDDNISGWDELGKGDKNVNFIILDAKSRAAVRAKNGTSQDGSGTNKSASMNSVIMGPGSNIKGDIIIIDQSKGDKTQVVD